MSVEYERIIAPVSINDVKKVLGLSSNDVGTLCTSSKVNMWSRYKPVCIPIPSIPDTLKSDKKNWAEAPIPLNYNWRTGLPWFYGSAFDRVFNVPRVSSIEDFYEETKTGNTSVRLESDDLLWSYNQPVAKYDPLNLAHFVGYNHEAECPINCGMPKSMMLNESFSLGLDYYNDDSAIEDGQFSWKDIISFIKTSIFHSSNVYLGIYILNRTQKTSSCYTKTKPINFSVDESFIFNLSVSNGSAISSGGMGVSIRKGDIVDVALFLSEYPGDTNLNGVSPRFESYDSCFKEYKAGQNADGSSQQTKAYKIPYSVSGVKVSINEQYQSVYWKDSNNDIFKCKRFITNIDGGTISTLGVSNAPSSSSGSINLVISAYMADGRTYFHNIGQAADLSKVISWNQNQKFSLKYLAGFSTRCYRKCDSSGNLSDPVDIGGLPVPDELVYAWTDNETGPVSGQQITLRINANSLEAYKALYFTGTDSFFKL